MKILEGIVISVGTGNTAVVEVYSKTPHPLYKKLIKRSKKYKVDFAGFEPDVGQKVKIAETRPISRHKYFKISEIVSSSKSEHKKPAASASNVADANAASHPISDTKKRTSSSSKRVKITNRTVEKTKKPATAKAKAGKEEVKK